MRKTSNKKGGAGTRIEAQGFRTRVTATKVGTVFVARTGRPKGPGIWEYQVRFGRRLARFSYVGTLREIAKDVRSLARRLAEREEQRSAA